MTPLELEKVRTKFGVSADVARLSSDLPAPPKVATNIIVRPTTDEDGLNKTEKAYLAYLRALRPPWIGVQCITLKLADDTRYTCDFFIIDANGQLCGHEVKGFWRDDAKAKIKVAARQFTWIRFQVVQRDKNNWIFSDIKP